MKPNITLIGVNFYPEDTAIGLYSTQMIQYLEANGYTVSVITGFPYYPQWEIYEEYQSKPRFFHENLGTTKILRYKQYVPTKPSFLKRIFHILDFTLGSLLNIRKVEKTDLIICVVPFTSTLLLGWLLKKRTKAKMWAHIQDFEFDAAIQTMVSKKANLIKSPILNFLFRIERGLLNKADVASTISNTMLHKLREKSKTNLAYFPNWIDIETINPKNSNIHRYLDSEKFKILYSGNVGDKQDWELFVGLVSELGNSTEIEIVIVGDGSKHDWLKSQLKDNEMVSFYEPVPYEELTDLLCSADLHILLQKKKVVDTVMPSKLLGMMASGKPSIVTGNSASEVKEVIQKSNGGIYLDTSNTSVLANAVIEMMMDQEKTKVMGQNARNYVVENFSKESILSKFMGKLEEMIK